MFSFKTTFGSSLMALMCGYSTWPEGLRKDRAKFGMLDDGLRSLQESKSFKLELRMLTSFALVLEESLLLAAPLVPAGSLLLSWAGSPLETRLDSFDGTPEEDVWGMTPSFSGGLEAGWAECMRRTSSSKGGMERALFLLALLFFLT